MRYIDKQTLIEVHTAYEDLILGNNELAYKQLGKILSNEQLNLHVVVGQSEQLFCGDLIKHNFSLSKIGRCIICDREKDKAK